MTAGEGLSVLCSASWLWPYAPCDLLFARAVPAPCLRPAADAGRYYLLLTGSNVSLHSGALGGTLCNALHFPVPSFLKLAF